MKKIIVLSVGALLLLSSCGTYAGSGAATGGWFGSIIGSAVGGITGGPRGSDIGSLIGMAGGAVVGAAIGQAADNAQQQRLEDYRRQRQQQRYEQQRYDEGDDRLYGFDENFGSTHAPMAYATEPCLEIRNPRIVDASRDGVLTRGEEARMVFEIYNTSTKPVTRVLPAVAEVISISACRRMSWWRVFCPARASAIRLLSGPTMVCAMARPYSASVFIRVTGR